MVNPLIYNQSYNFWLIIESEAQYYLVGMEQERVADRMGEG